jgi:hypothetical protein
MRRRYHRLACAIALLTGLCACDTDFEDVYLEAVARDDAGPDAASDEQDAGADDE